MARFDERLELAPRDVVARAIDHELKRLGLDYVHLDISHRDPAFVREHFPTIHEKLLGLGIDMTAEPIPVVPAQHYTCGGVTVDLDGRTDLPGLYAAGEVTESGLHGANRLASNSLLECFVFGEAAARHMVAHWDELDTPPPVRPWDESRVTDSDEEVVIKQNWTEIRRFMWNYVRHCAPPPSCWNARRTASRCWDARSRSITASSGSRPIWSSCAICFRPAT